MTKVIIDANICLALALPLPYSREAVDRMQVWQRDRVELLVPTLWEYEVVTGLRRACLQGLITPEESHVILGEILDLAIEVIAPTFEQHQRALVLAERLGQSKIYDTQYLALAQQISAEFWTADKRLAQRSGRFNLDWVHCIS
jgi:predicted nucleic acid-binding protein